MVGRKQNREKEYITKISNEKIKNFNFEGDYLYKDKPCETFVRDFTEHAKMIDQVK